MRFRKLRIAWSVVWILTAGLLIVLWVRSYWQRTSVEILVTPTHRYYLHSLRGTVALEREFRAFLGIEFMRVYQESDYLRLTTNGGLKIELGSDGNINAFSISYWLLIVTDMSIAIIPWIRWSKRFTLRTLLIAMTAVAAVLGGIAHVAHQ